MPRHGEKMKTVKVHAHCTVCDFAVEYDLDTNEHGFFVMPQGFCPNDLLILDQEIRRDTEDGE
jgi:hypothetical protein